MSSLLNKDRPLYFCPGCGHESVVRAVDKAAVHLGLTGEQLVIVTDIGCAGLFDTFFKTHAIHGLHGRALTYATGLKMVRPELHVLVIMGDGGLGIGGAHVLASCRRNLDISLLVLNNFNYGMTGGQCSSTTPANENTSSGFLGSLEEPLDICSLAEASGVQCVEKAMATDGGLWQAIVEAIEHPGFSLLDIWGLCPGRHLKKNPKTISQFQVELKSSGRSHSQGNSPGGNENVSRIKEDYGVRYRRAAARLDQVQPLREVAATITPRIEKRVEMLILGAAGQYIGTVGEILGLAAMASGLSVAQKNDYPITVLRGYSVAELVFDTEPIGYTGVEKPGLILCVAQEGVSRRRAIFQLIDEDSLVLSWPGLDIPKTRARVEQFSTDGAGVRKNQRALALAARLVAMEHLVDPEALEIAIKYRYSGGLQDTSLELVRTICA